MLSISKALRISSSRIIAFVGAGGKTSAMFQAARELSPVLVTTSTHLLNGQGLLADHHLIWEPDGPMPELEAWLGSGITLVTGNLDPVKQRYLGATPTQLEKLRQLAGYHNLPLLIESDGARQRAIKAPAEHEPAIPGFVDMVVVVAGLTGLGRNLGEEAVHRPEIFGSLCGLNQGEIVTPSALARVLSHPMGGVKNIPPGARRVVLLNEAYTPELQSQANEIGQMLLPVFDAVIVAALQPPPGVVIAVKQNTAGIILAAGASSRFGQPKQLLDYHGEPFVRVVAKTALKAGLSPVVVVVGANADAITKALENLPLTIVHNSEWMAGQSTSMKAGLNHLPDNTGGAIFLLADQPQVSVELLRALMEPHSQDLPPILAPYVFDQRANPLLFDRITFADLLTVTGDTGGRAIFSKFSPFYLNWYDKRLLLDVDTPDDYQKLLNQESDS